MTGTFKAFTYKQQQIKPEDSCPAAFHTAGTHITFSQAVCDPVQYPATPVVLLQLRLRGAGHHLEGGRPDAACGGAPPVSTARIR
jgi:hypothetical protein